MDSATGPYPAIVPEGQHHSNDSSRDREAISSGKVSATELTAGSAAGSTTEFASPAASADAVEAGDEMLLMEYLDGELSSERRRNLEERLVGDPALRRTLSELEQSWQSLEILDRATSDKKLAETTIETVVFSAEVEVAALAEKEKRRRIPKILVILCLIFCGVVVGHGAVHFFVPDPRLYLLLDMPIIERFDRYQEFINFKRPELLLRLAGENVFGVASVDGENPARSATRSSGSELDAFAFSTAPPPRVLRYRFEQINSLDPVHYGQFHRNYERFTKMNEQRQAPYRELNTMIGQSQSPTPLMIDRTLTAFIQWFRMLPTDEKLQFSHDARSLPLDDCVAIVKEKARRASSAQSNDLENGGHREDFAPGAKPSDRDLAEFLLQHVSLKELDRFLTLSPNEGISKLEADFERYRQDPDSFDEDPSPGENEAPVIETEPPFSMPSTFPSKQEADGPPDTLLHAGETGIL
ncbi:MAG TPA: hypothetical protein DEB39_09695 [Planctomycetaceae bacterium]|nr:hypothetical protein [Planctomycetaceae bacterium]